MLGEHKVRPYVFPETLCRGEPCVRPFCQSTEPRIRPLSLNERSLRANTRFAPTGSYHLRRTEFYMQISCFPAPADFRLLFSRQIKVTGI